MTQRNLESPSRSARQTSRDATEPTSSDHLARLHSILFRVFIQSRYFKRSRKRELCYKCQLCNNSGVYVHGWMTEWGLVMHQSSSLKHLGMFQTFERYMKVVEEVKYWARRAIIERVNKEKKQYDTGIVKSQAPIQQKQTEFELLNNAQARDSEHVYECVQAPSRGDTTRLLEHLVEMALKNPISHTSSDLIATCSINWALRRNALTGLEWAAETLRVREVSTEIIEPGTRLESCEVDVLIGSLCETGLETRQVGSVPQRPRPTSLSVILNPSSPPRQPFHPGGASALKGKDYGRGDGNIVFGTEASTSRSQTPTSSLVNDVGPYYKQNYTSTPNQICEKSPSRLSSGSVSNPELTAKVRVGHKDYVGCVWCGRPNTPARGDGTCSKNFPMRHHDELILDL